MRLSTKFISLWPVILAATAAFALISGLAESPTLFRILVLSAMMAPLFLILLFRISSGLAASLISRKQAISSGAVVAAEVNP